MKIKNHKFINKKRPISYVLENQIHTAIARYLDFVIKRPSRWHTVEVSNQQGSRAGMFKQIALKKKGVRTGWPDIEILWTQLAGKGFLWEYATKLIFFEVKIPGKDADERQKILHQELREDGHYVYVVHSIEEVIAIFEELGVI